MIDERSLYIYSLRQLATLLEQEPELPLPANLNPFFWFETKEDLAAAAHLMPGRKIKNDPTHSSGDGYNATYYSLTGKIGVLPYTLAALRSEVCERVLVGTETIVETVPDPDARMIRRERVVEKYEWRCGPLLSAVA